MKVANARLTSSPRRPSQGGGAGTAGDGFARALDGIAPPRAEGILGATPGSAVPGVLAAQEVQTATERDARRRAVQRGELLLDELERLRIAIVSGVVNTERLVALAGMVRARGDAVDDPELTAVIAEIELRVAVELAKRQRSR